MNRSTFLGSAASVLLILSVISYSRSFIQPQDPKPAKQAQTSSQQPISQSGTGQSDGQESKVTGPSSTAAVGPASSTNAVTEKTTGPTAPSANESASASLTVAAAAETYMATAYSLPGHTASGLPVGRGLIAADPSVLPFGTRVRLDGAGYSGEYIVADAGTAVKGRRIDIWMPTMREARHFGLHAMKLTVLSYGPRRVKPVSNRTRPRRVATSN